MFPKADEIYSDLRIPKGWFYIRLDGWNFRSLSRKLELKRPFDYFLAECLVETAKIFFNVFNPSLAFLFSDEINLLLSNFTAFGRRMEKIDSIFAGLASSCLCSLLSKRYSDVPEVSFDCRIIPTKEEDKTLEYLIWRQKESYKNCYNSYAQYCLIRRKGLEPRRAAEKLRNRKLKDLKRLIQQHAIKLSQIPKWHERGILIHWERFSKEGFDPTRKREVIAIRRRVKVEWFPPRFDTKKGEQLLRKLIQMEG